MVVTGNWAANFVVISITHTLQVLKAHENPLDVYETAMVALVEMLQPFTSLSSSSAHAADSVRSVHHTHQIQCSKAACEPALSKSRKNHHGASADDGNINEAAEPEPQAGLNEALASSHQVVLACKLIPQYAPQSANPGYKVRRLVLLLNGEL